MQHLNKIKAARKLSEEEEIVELGQANKYARRTAKENRRKRNGQGHTLNDDAGSSVSTKGVHTIRWIREEKRPSDADFLDKEIARTRELIALLTETMEIDGDPDGELYESIKQCRLDLRRLLVENIAACKRERNMDRSPRDETPTSN